MAATVKRVLLVALVLCGCAKRDRIIVGAKNFTESDLLAEIVASGDPCPSQSQSCRRCRVSTGLPERSILANYSAVNGSRAVRGSAVTA